MEEKKTSVIACVRSQPRPSQPGPSQTASPQPGPPQTARHSSGQPADLSHQASCPRSVSGVGAGLAPAQRGGAELLPKQPDASQSPSAGSPRSRRTVTSMREGASPSPTPEAESFSLGSGQPGGDAETNASQSRSAGSPRSRRTATSMREGASPSPTPEAESFSLGSGQPGGDAETSRKPVRHRGIGLISPKALLLRRCLAAASQEKDWELLLERHGDAIRKTAGGALRAVGLEANTERVEELCQEVYLRWWRGSTPFDGRTDAAFWNFIQSSIRHALNDHLRRLSAIKRKPRGRLWMCAHVGSPYEVLMRNERRRLLVRHCLEAGAGDSQPNAARSRRQAQALGWVVFAGCTSREASRLTGIRRQRVDHLVRRLRGNMSRQGISLPRRCKG